MQAVQAMAVLSRLDVDMTNLDAAGTVRMMEAAIEGLTRPDGTRPMLIAVTQLTSTDEETMKADLLIIFSDIDGLYDCDPRENENAKIIDRVTEINDDIRALAGGAGTKLGTGGMVTKIHAAEVCFENDIPMVITNGAKIENAYDIIAGKVPGTLFMK